MGYLFLNKSRSSIQCRLLKKPFKPAKKLDIYGFKDPNFSWFDLVGEMGAMAWVLPCLACIFGGFQTSHIKGVEAMPPSHSISVVGIVSNSEIWGHIFARGDHSWSIFGCQTVNFLSFNIFILFPVLKTVLIHINCVKFYSFALKMSF